MEPEMLCTDDHKPKDGYWYPGRSYSELEIVFDLGRLFMYPFSEFSAYCDYDGWVREKRIMFAKQRLSETKDSVGMIAASCGYANPGKFGSMFRECTRISPLEYRRLDYRE